MFHGIKTSRNAKTGNIAQTYRAGAGNIFGTCPSSCQLNPKPLSSTKHVDKSYLKDLLGAVPRRGVAFAYTHFSWIDWAPEWKQHRIDHKATTTVNFSADSRAEAAAAFHAGVPTVIAIPEKEAVKHEKMDGVRYVQCPATYQDNVQCENCGGGDPLCARPDRDYVITFPAHGTAKKRVGDESAGGCYAASGNVALHWREFSKKEQCKSDGALLRAFVKTLRPGSILRHHIAGDIGLAKQEIPVVLESAA